MSRGFHARFSKVDCQAVAEEQLIWLGRHTGSRAGRRRLSLGWPRIAGTSRIITRLRSPDYSLNNTNIAPWIKVLGAQRARRSHHRTARESALQIYSVAPKSLEPSL